MYKVASNGGDVEIIEIFERPLNQDLLNQDVCIKPIMIYLYMQGCENTVCKISSILLIFMPGLFYFGFWKQKWYFRLDWQRFLQG